MTLAFRAICILALAPLEPVVAQSLAQRVAAAPDGEVEFRFASRPGVCGDGKGVIGDQRVQPTSRRIARGLTDPEYRTLSRISRH